MAARRKSDQDGNWIFAVILTAAYGAAIFFAIPFVRTLSASPPWGWVMMAALLYFALAVLSIVLHLWGIKLGKKILFIPF